MFKELGGSASTLAAAFAVTIHKGLASAAHRSPKELGWPSASKHSAKTAGSAGSAAKGTYAAAAPSGYRPKNGASQKGGVPYASPCPPPQGVYQTAGGSGPPPSGCYKSLGGSRPPP